VTTFFLLGVFSCLVTSPDNPPGLIDLPISTRTTLEVGTGQTYTSIQDAIDNATAGDTVRVHAGTYHELVLVNKTINLVGNGSINTTIDGGLAGSVVNVTAPWCNITGIKINNSGLALDRAGIVVHAGNVTIEECNATDNYFGIWTIRAFNTTVINSECYHNTDGIQLFLSHNSTIRNVTANGNHENGIHSLMSDGVTIENSSADDCELYGIYVDDCFDNILLNNSVRMCGYGLFGGRSYNCWDSQAIGTDNLVNGKPVYYWENRNSGTIPLDAGQVMIVYSQNVQIEDLALSNCTIGVKLVQSDHCNLTNIVSDSGIYGIEIVGWDNVISNSVISNANKSGIYINGANNGILDTQVFGCENSGIKLVWCSKTIIKNCTMDSNGKDDWSFGLILSSSSWSQIDDCVFSGSLYGATLRESYWNVFTGCTATKNNITGIHLSSSSNANVFRDCNLVLNENNGMMLGDLYYNRSNDNIIENCNFSNNVNSGLAIRECSGNIIRNCTSYSNKYGISIAEKGANTIKNCTLKKNTFHGVNLYFRTGFNTVTQNFLLDNTGYGVYIASGNNNNSVIYNSFYDNNGGNKQAFDIGKDNTWNSVDKGNYWSDWTSPDINKDGIVDDPYKIDGIVGSLDDYPIALPFGTFMVLTQDVKTAVEEEEYSVNYTVFAIDVIDVDAVWSFESNATWLNFSEEQVLSGIPTNEDVGTNWVKISVVSPIGAEYRNFTLQVLNVNDPPVIDDSLYVKMLINQSEPYYVDFDATDIDLTLDKLVWDIDTEADFLLMNSTTGVLNGTPGNNDIGVFNVSVYVTDTKGGYDWFNYTLSVIDLNDAPQAKNVSIYLFEDETDYQIPIDDFVFDPDGDDFSLFFSKMKYMKIAVEVDYVSVVPDPDWNGLETVSVIADDGKDSTTFVVSLNVLPVNDAPTDLRILGISNNTHVDNGTALNLTAYVEDVDLQYEGDTYTYLWRSSTGGEMGTEENLPKLVLPPGNHTITLKATDKEGNSIETSVTVVVREPHAPQPDDDIVDDDTGDDDTGDDTPFFVYLLPAIGLLILVAIGTIILVIVMKKKLAADGESPAAPEGRAMGEGEAVDWDSGTEDKEQGDEDEKEVEE